jgi:DNA polymerase III delta prime subunit
LLQPSFNSPYVEFGVTAKPTSSNDSSSAASSNPNDHLRINNEGSNLELEPHVLNPCDSNTSNINDEGAVALDEDPNESRRKRRRTDKTQTTEPTTAARAGLSAWLGVSAPAPLNPLTDVANDPDTTLSTFQLGTPPAETPAEDATKVSTLTEKEPQSRAARSSARQKILKLNSNGKFLSSPASSPPPETEKNGTGKRRRARKEETKVVIFKYGLGKEGKIGTLINDILNGLTRTTPWKSAIQPRKKKSQSRKPTHPFFNKTSMHNTGTPNSIDGQPDSPKAPTQTTAGTPVKKRVVPASDISFSKIPRRVSKFPELVHPTWPPKDLVHVRDTNPPLLGINGRAWYKSQDKKKSKIAAISIRDEENVLLTGTAEARKIARLSTIEAQDIPAILRHPVRHVASSHVLQAAMERQMSWSSPNRQFHWTATTPPLAKLRLALLSSVSAIDRGKYESHLWPHKYAPTSANEVLQLGREPQMLRDWLRHLKITAVDTGSSSKENVKSKLKEEKKRKKRQKRDKLDGFVVSSEEEVSEMDNISGSDDELAGNVTTLSQKTVVRSGDMVSGSNGTVNGQLSNAILISGPPGCGKTASVYAVAKELDFEVFEINAGSRRTARDMLERVGDMTQNHLVHLLNETDSAIDSNKADVKPNNLMGFFKGPSTKVSKSADTTSQSENETKRPREQKQCLILLEEADILFEEDRQFWTGVLTLISQSKRPIIITCNDESLIPTREMSLHAILRYQKPSPDFVIDYLLLVAANEGHILKREAVTRLYQGSGLDLRKSLMDLNFWCQMGVGSDKSGLDWLLPAWPPESNVDQNGDRLRVLSLNTYERYMGWFNRDLLSTHSSLDGETEVIRNSFHNWGVGLQDSEDMAGRSEVELLSPHSVQSSSKVDQLDMICREADYYDMRSSLDMLCSNFSTEMKKVSDIDTLSEI